MYQPLLLDQTLVDHQLERARLETLASRPQPEVTRRHRFGRGGHAASSRSGSCSQG